MNRRTGAAWITAACLLVFAVQGDGCANLEAIREFAAISARSAEYTGLVDQYVDTPVRQKRFQPDDQQDRLEQMRRLRASQRERLLLRQALVAEYMDALGKLAADEIVDYDSGIDDLGRAVVANNFAGEHDADAFASLTKTLLRAATDTWRQKQLQKLITESNAPFQEVLGALKRIVDQDFAGDIENEKLAMTKHYETLIRSSNDRAGISALEEWRDARFAEADARARAISSYSQVLSTIASGHQQLYDRRDDLGSPELIRQLKLYAKDLGKLVNALRSP